MSDVYVQIKHGKVARTIPVKRFGHDRLGLGDYIVDLDTDGEVLGIEVLGARSVRVDGKEVM